MTRSLPLAAALSLAALACLSTPVQAESKSSLSLYGLVDVSAGSFQNAGETDRGKVESGALSTSFIGFRGSEDLGGTLKVKFALEHELQADTGVAGRTGSDAFWGRTAYVGLEGDFGSTVLGRNVTPLFVSTLAFNALGDSFGFSPGIRQLFTPSTGQPFFGDSRWSNSLLYSSPTSDGGYSFSLIGNVGESAAGAKGNNLGGSLMYFGSAFAATLAAQRVKNPATGAPAGWEHQDTLQLGASYDFGVAKLYGQATRVKTQATVETRSTLYGLGASVPLGAGRLIAQYGHAKAELDLGDNTQNTVTLGYDYALSKLTDAYVVAMNDRRTQVEHGNSIALGVRVRF